MINNIEEITNIPQLYMMRAEHQTSIEDIETQLSYNEMSGKRGKVWELRAIAAMGHLQIELQQLQSEIDIREVELLDKKPFQTSSFNPIHTIREGPGGLKGSAPYVSNNGKGSDPRGSAWESVNGKDGSGGTT